METSSRTSWLEKYGRVVSLPMRDGNPHNSPFLRVGTVVVSLPMRDGNVMREIGLLIDSGVVSLPMRDGNVDKGISVHSAEQLLAYL